MPKLKSIPDNLQGITRFNIEISDVEPVNKLFSKCFIKILYPGLNRNNVFITKEVATEMAKTLVNTPIVGEFIEHKDDFGTHGGKIEITDESIEFIQTTKPWGFIPESTEISWQNVTEADGTVREYLTCVGYLWSGRYPEIHDVISSARPQSMELFEDTLEGYWKREGGKEVFHLTKADFSALCILGNDVEPAFESANIGSYYVMNPISFSKKYNRLLRDFESSLPDLIDKKVSNFSSSANTGNQEGGSTMDLFKLNLDEDNIKYQLYNKLNPINDDKERIWNYSIVTVTDNDFIAIEEATNAAYKYTYTYDDKTYTYGDPQEITIGEIQQEDRTEIEDLQKQFTELNEQHEQLQNDYTKVKEEGSIDTTELDTLRQENDELKQFKLAVEKTEKEAIIKEFTEVLGEDSVKEYSENIDNYTKEDLEQKLALIAYKQKANFAKGLIPDKETKDTNLSGAEQLMKKYY